MNADPQHLGKYELQVLLGRGGISEVWKALDTQSQRYVIINMLQPDLQNDPNFLVRFEQEAQKVAPLHHPNIVHIRDFQIVHLHRPERMLTYLVTDYIENTQLCDYIHTMSATKKFPSHDTIVQLFASVSAAIDYAHHHSVIHRNINPTNILLDIHNTSRNPIGEPLLRDFGIATILGLASSPRPGTFQGNPGYMAPEQVQGYPGNELSDIYSLGVILYEVCTGARPFQADNPTNLMAQHVNTTPISPALFRPNIPPPLTLVLLRGLEKDPAKRFANAWAMAVALADALNVFIPDDLRLPVPSIDTMNLPTYLTPSYLNLPAGATPPLWPLAEPSSSQPARGLSIPSGTTSALSPAVLADQPPHISLDKGQSPTITPVDSIAEVPPTHTLPGPTTIVSSKETLIFPPPPFPKRRRKGSMMALIGMVLLLLGATGLGVFYLLPRTDSATARPTGPAIVGHSFFVSSGQVSENSNLGINDEIKITLQIIAAPPPGKNYYAWLLGDNNGVRSTSILLGQLPVIHGNANLLYSDKEHRDLLATTNRLLITEEDARTTPVRPSLNKSNWRYTAEFLQTPTPHTNYSLLDQLRDLLSGDPKLDALGLRGGLASGLVRNIETIMIWAGSARDYWKSKNTQFMRAQCIRILDVLDSAAYVKVEGDVPPGTPLLINNRVALLEFDSQHQDPPGYLDHTRNDVSGLINAPGVTKDQIKLAGEINNSLNTVLHWLEQVRKDAMQLEHDRDDTQLLSQTSLSILNDMAAQALFAYVGQLDPTTNQVIKGAEQIGNDLERLATLDITSYMSK